MDGEDVDGGEVVEGAVAGGVVAGGVVVGTLEEGVGGTVGSGAVAGTGTSVNTIWGLGTVVTGDGDGDAGAVAVAAGCTRAGGVVGTTTAPGGDVVVVVVEVDAGSPTTFGAGPAPAVRRSSAVGMVARELGIETCGREAVAAPRVRAASPDTPAQTSPAEIVPTTRNRSAFIRDVLLVPCHQSRSRSDAPGRPNGALFPMAWPER